MTARSAQPRTLRARIVTSNESSLEVLADLVASADALRAEADALRARLSAGKLVAVAAAARDMIVKLRIRGAVPEGDYLALVDAARIVLCRQRLLLHQLLASGGAASGIGPAAGDGVQEP
ncbi:MULTISPECIES: hypothetical protein [Microbacterium]|jgi:hypothetical protein|uniref:hypothetical protein n=1 Tax=Microbacterium TaxID=33882 RepID=UPI00073446D9|nr:hypothetical protein [Microbacterium oxydans]KTR75037.1 hypothetical protein NS234_16995 [Microbacterium oxydans]RCL91060.1 MAG: hypothetical protein DBW62_02950 [Microbacterium sp.]